MKLFKVYPVIFPFKEKGFFHINFCVFVLLLCLLKFSASYIEFFSQQLYRWDIDRVKYSIKKMDMSMMSNIWTKIKILYFKDKIWVNPNIEDVIYILLYHIYIYIYIYIVPTSTYIAQMTRLWYKRVHNLKVHTSNFY